MKKIKIILFLFLLCSSNAWTQQPSHFILGEEELSGINIYDLHQDQFGMYWIATNNGIYNYDSYKIRKVDCHDMTSSSVFSLIEDYNNNVYCHNLSGQIFQINKDTCLVYFTIPDSLITREISYEFDLNNTLTIASSRLFQVSENKVINFIYDKKVSYNFYIYRDPDGYLVFYDMSNSNVLTIKKESIESKIIKTSSLITPVVVFHKNNTIFYDRESGDVIPQLSSGSNLQVPDFKFHNKLTRYYSDNTNYWVSNMSGGVYIFDENYVVKNNYQPIFTSSIISSFLKDREGNIILGTFSNGLIVIPNLDIVDFQLNPPTTKVTRLTSSKNSDIYFGTQEGEIFMVDSLNQISQIKEKGIQQIEILEFLPNINCLLYNGKNKNLLDLSPLAKLRSIFIHGGSFKDIHQLNDHEYLIASNGGVSIFDSRLLDTEENEKMVISIKNFDGRSYCVGYDYNTKSIYCGTSLGLKIGDNDSAELFKYKGKPVFCRKIINVDGNVFVTTKKNGILIFKNDILIDVWNEKSGLLSNNTKNIMEYNNQLFLSTDLGLNILSKNGQVLNTINKSIGLNANNVVDFDIIKGYLWILTNKGIQRIKLDKITNSNYIPSIEITNIEVNETLIDTNIHRFDYTQKKFVFEIASKSLKYKNDIYYQYQLKGIDKGWVTNPYNNNFIEYKSLPPNRYIFKVKAIHKSNSSSIIQYSFIIEKPFWTRWWFYVLIFASILTLVLVIFRIEFKRQKKKTRLQNQLSLTQLTALKSQMNPHFIFNSLNSIQDLILQQDRQNAYNYISKFALLVRKILHHSDKDFIEIEDEVKILNVYLELEELRFKKDFSFTIKTNNITDIEIPPMLIQPFVENALKHGLLHKKGDKILSIEFNLTNGILTCEVIDNGIGRQKSYEIKQRQKKSHDSFSVKSITNRFDILKDLYGKDIGVKFDDLVSQNVAIGTKITLKIPFKRRF